MAVQQFSPVDPLISSVYRTAFHRLRAIAQKLLSKERRGHTLPPTALVHEAFLKLRNMRHSPSSEEHVFFLSAYAMKQVLIDHGRVRGKWVSSATVSESLRLAAVQRLDRETETDINLKLEKLRKNDAHAAGAIRLRYYEGLPIHRIAANLGRTEAQVRVDLQFALEWLASQLSSRT